MQCTGRLSGYQTLHSIGMSMAMDTKDKVLVITLLHSSYVTAGMDTSGETYKRKEQVEPIAVAEKLRAVLLKKGIDDTGRFCHTGAGVVLITIQRKGRPSTLLMPHSVQHTPL
jgi:hydroxymethylglutaryl-CoA reductase